MNFEQIEKDILKMEKRFIKRFASYWGDVSLTMLNGDKEDTFSFTYMLGTNYIICSSIEGLDCDTLKDALESEIQGIDDYAITHYKSEIVLCLEDNDIVYLKECKREIRQMKTIQTFFKNELKKIERKEKKQLYKDFKYNMMTAKKEENLSMNDLLDLCNDLPFHMEYANSLEIDNAFEVVKQMSTRFENELYLEEIIKCCKLIYVDEYEDSFKEDENEIYLVVGNEELTINKNDFLVCSTLHYMYTLEEVYNELKGDR